MRWLFCLFVVLLSGCVANAPFRTGDGKDCPDHWGGCGSYYETHERFDLGFVEYSERGNDFNPEQTKKLLESIEKQSKSGNLAVVVFIHGWNHNASTRDENVKEFTTVLESIQDKGVVGTKKLVGVYIGWRGKSFNGMKAEISTFWDRKSTAEEVGRGGVTRFLLDLEYIAKRNDENFMLTIGHSFGAAIALSALHDVVLEKMIVAERGKELVTFGDGIVLLNPAIEANQALLLKESSMRLGAQNRIMPSVMHVISSTADIPTNWAFPVGQFFGVTLRWNQNVLPRVYEGARYDLSEVSLDQQTIGNYEGFTTTVIKDSNTRESRFESLPFDESVSTIRPLKGLGGGKWTVESNCLGRAWSSEVFPCFKSEPVDFISVPKSFIKNHNDVFNEAVRALLSVVIEESYFTRSKVKRVPNPCTDRDGGFSFGNCFNSYYASYTGDKNKPDLFMRAKP